MILMCKYSIKYLLCSSAIELLFCVLKKVAVTVGIYSIQLFGLKIEKVRTNIDDGAFYSNDRMAAGFENRPLWQNCSLYIGCIPTLCVFLTTTQSLRSATVIKNSVNQIQ